MTKENLFGSGACTLFSHRVTYSLHDGGSHGMNLVIGHGPHTAFTIVLRYTLFSPEVVIPSNDQTREEAPVIGASRY